jgi:hypothetical protein
MPRMNKTFIIFPSFTITGFLPDQPGEFVRARAVV